MRNQGELRSGSQDFGRTSFQFKTRDVLRVEVVINPANADGTSGGAHVPSVVFFLTPHSNAATSAAPPEEVQVGVVPQPPAGPPP